MIQIQTIRELRDYLKKERLAGKSIGFVPTMGYLHEGHASLAKKASEMCDVVVMSIFVNPLQFGANEDLDSYPRDLQRDWQIAQETGVHVLFTPTVQEMYPGEMLTTVTVSQVTEHLCGKSRPTHFQGVATVVSKLFNIVLPDYAFFGQKDAQQVAVIEQMVHDLSIPVAIVPCPTVREEDGLAKSSRNVYLTEEERKQAAGLYQSLLAAEKLLQEGERQASVIRQRMVERIEALPLATIDYVEVMRYPQMQPAEQLQDGERICIALAVKFGKTRLIDNLILTV